MLRLLLILLLIFLHCHSASAVISYDQQGLDDSFLLPPQIENEKLNNRVNFSFHDTDLSDILLMLSKVGEFNVVMPDKYNKKITVKLSNQRIVDAIEDITELTGLTYNFKGNSLLISGKDTQGQVFTSVPIIYCQSQDMVEALNSSLFKQLAISQDPAKAKPHASADPTKNAVIIVGDEDQVKAAKDFITKLDTPPLVKIYTPSFLTMQDARKLISNNLSKLNSVKLKRYEKNSFILTGVADEVNVALDLLRTYDAIPQPISLVANVYAVRAIDLETFLLRNNFMDTTKVYDFNSNITQGEAFTSLFKYMDKVYQQKFDTNTSPPVNILGITVQAETNLLDQNTFTLTMLGETFASVARDDQIVRLIDKEQLKTYKDIKKNLAKSHADLVLVIIRAI